MIKDDRVNFELNTDPKYSSPFPSNTVEALLSQNEDLMARLTVILRRNSELESRYKVLNENFQRTQESNDSLIDEVGILREKTKKFESLYLNHKADKEDLEKRFASAYSGFQEKGQNFTYQISLLNKKVALLSRFAERIKKYIRPLLEKNNAQIKYLDTQVLDLGAKRMSKEEMVSGLQHNLREMTEKNHHQTKDFASDIGKLTEHHERATQSLRGEIKTLESEITLFEGRESDLKLKIEGFIEKNIQLENRLILLERRKSEQLDNHTEEIQKLETTIREVREAKGKMEMEVLYLKPQVDEFKKSESLHKKEISELKLDLETITSVHQEAMSALQTVTDKASATDILNRELAKALEKQRRDFSETKLKRIELDIKKSGAERIEDMSANSKVVQNKAIIDRIELLFSEIQSGFISELPLDVKDQLISERGEIDEIL